MLCCWESANGARGSVEADKLSLARSRSRSAAVRAASRRRDVSEGFREGPRPEAGRPSEGEEGGVKCERERRALVS